MKRFRKPKLKDGELRMYWGKPDRWDSPDIVLAWQGNRMMKRDTNLLHYMLCIKRPKIELGRINWAAMEPSLIEELELRGYDLTTLKFSIRKKASLETLEAQYTGSAQDIPDAHQ